MITKWWGCEGNGKFFSYVYNHFMFDIQSWIEPLGVYIKVIGSEPWSLQSMLVF